MCRDIEMPKAGIATCKCGRVTVTALTSKPAEWRVKRTIEIMKQMKRQLDGEQ